MKTLSWEDLANFYCRKTGGFAYTKQMEDVYKWATEQEEIVVNKDSSLSFRA